jgi:hypothetical protein
MREHMNPFYKILNPAIACLLRGPLHRIVSGNLMLITFTGRKSGKTYTTPVRYVSKGADILCFTTPVIPWWRNLVGGAEVDLLIKGESGRYLATALVDEPERIRENLNHYFSVFPGDAMFYYLKLDRQKRLGPEALQKAMRKMVVIEARRLP